MNLDGVTENINLLRLQEKAWYIQPFIEEPSVFVSTLGEYPVAPCMCMFVGTPTKFRMGPNWARRGAAAEGRGPPVLSIALEYMGMVLDFPCLALEAQLIQKSVN